VGKSIVKIFVFLFVLTLFSAGGCNKSAPTAALAGQAQPKSEGLRIISAAPSNTEIIVGLGLGANLVAVDKWSKDIAGVNAALPEVDFFYPDAEAILALQPDVIVSSEINNFGAADSPFKPLLEMGIRVVQVPTSKSLAGIYGDIVTIARSLGVGERGEEMAAGLREAVESYAEKGKQAARGGRKKVFFEVTPAPELTTFGSGTYLNEMIELVGAVNIFAGQKGWFSPGAEAILERDPDVILSMDMTGYGVRSEEDRFAHFATVTAVKEKRIYTIDADSAGRPTQNIILALDQMARAIYPEVYGPR
jgi:iron complex transport system substrate-binding protein